MTENDNTPGRADRIIWTIATLSLAGMMAMIGMMELGEVAHDAFCPDHGWAVDGSA